MKKRITVFILAFYAGMMSMFAQDVMTLKSGEELEVTVTEVGKEEVWYKKFSNPDGPLYSLPKSDIFMIKYPNGEKDVFGVQPSTVSPAPQVIIYNKKEPVLACFLSFLLPGGGQYYNGQYGKGALMTGIAVASLIGVTASSSDASYYNNYGYYRESGSDSGAAFFALLYVGNYLWSIIDAPVTANKINKKNGLLSWDLGKNVNLSLKPDLGLTSSLPTGHSFFAPNYGAKLVLKLH